MDTKTQSRTITAEGGCLLVPVWTNPDNWDRHTLEIRAEDGALLYRFRLPDARADADGAAPDYFASLPLRRADGTNFRGALSIRCDAPYPVLEQLSWVRTPPDYPAQEELHYHAPYGSLNDPNGLVFADGVWHLYHQHNPLDNIWGNMTWGHAVSRDLVHFRFLGDVLFPDADGVMFSGCGLRNERGAFGLPREALLFFYTLAAEDRGPDGGKLLHFTQRMAWSADGGRSLIKYADWELPTMEGENRDPKIFWHQESNAYIMSLYLTGGRFAFLRSADLMRWETTAELDVPPMWECPDLVRLTNDLWAFMSADGYYYIGRFDGYRWQTLSDRQNLYTSAVPYAAQSYSGISGRVVSVAWLRTENRGEPWHGMMSVPRELSLGRDDQGHFYLRQAFVREAAPYIRTERTGAVAEDTKIRETISPDGRFLTVEQLF